MSQTSPTAAPEMPETQGPEFDFLTWFEVNKKLLSILLGVVVVAVVAGMFIRDRRAAAELAANQAVISLSSATNTTSAAYLEVARTHKGTRAAERATLLAAGQRYSEGKYAEARGLFESVASEFPNSPTVATALLGVAGSLAAEGKSQDAITAYQRVITAFPGDAVSLRARLSKAHLLEAANQFDQALALYEEVTKDPTAGIAMQSAYQSRAKLLQKHPELDKSASATNAVKAPAAPVKPSK